MTLLMSWYTIFYLFSIAESLGNLLLTVAVIAAIVSGFCAIAYFVTGGDVEMPPKVLKWTIPVAFVFGLLFALLPSKKDMLLIVAGGAVGEFITTDANAKALPADITKWLRTEIKSATAELNPATQAEKEKLMNMPQEELVKQLMAAKDSTLTR